MRSSGSASYTTSAEVASDSGGAGVSRAERGKCGTALNYFRTLGQKRGVPGVQVDVAGGCPSACEAEGLVHYKGNRFGFDFAYRFGGSTAPLGLVQNLMRQFVSLRRELPQCGLPGNNAILPP